jgi:carbonic anhydrase/acetyltransferase-like protein (isoleucine patch superfamily)
LRNPPGFHLVRPNTPVAPFAAPLSTATFVDPSAHIFNGNHVVAGQKTYVGLFATLNATTGYIKIGSGSAVLDNASVISNPNNIRQFPTNVIIGDSVQVGYGAIVLGPSTIGAFGSSAKNTGIGPNALIDGATIDPGAIVGALARVGPGVTVPAGIYVLPGSNVTTDAQASDPALGLVEKIPSSVASDLSTELTRDAQLAAGYTNLYQGNSATGPNPGTTSATVFNGDLAAVEGLSQEPGNQTTTALTGINFEPSAASPAVVGPFSPSVQVTLPNFHGRIVGGAKFGARVHSIARHIGHANAIRGDQGQPLVFANAPTTGNAVTINAPLGGTTTSGGTQGTITTGGVTFVTLNGAKTTTVGGVTVGRNLNMGTGSVLLGGTASSYALGDNVTIGAGAVVVETSTGSDVTIGPRAYVANSTLAPGTVIPAGTVEINNKVVGHVQW